MVGNVRVEGLVEYTRSQLECLAANLLRRRVDIPFRAPIRVQRLLESRDVFVKPMSGLLNKYSVEGAVCNEFMTRRLTVFIDYHLMNGPDDARYNAVIGEELAHIELHRSQIHQVKCVEDFLELRRCKQWRQIERDARTFSAAVRMPESLITRHADAIYRQTVDDLGFGEPHTIAKVFRNRLAELFVVPVDDMHARLVQWPCSISARVIASVQAASDTLLPSGNEAPLPYVQRAFIDD